LSKFFFDEFPSGFPFARYVPVWQQGQWAMSKTRYRASSFKDLKSWTPHFYRVGEFREVSSTWTNRNVCLQRFCFYSVSGLHCGTFNGREYLFVHPSSVQLRGWKSSFTEKWYRLGMWRLERFGKSSQKNPSFVFEGKFSASQEVKSKILASTSMGKLWINGLDKGVFSCFNLHGLADWQVHTLGFESVQNPEICYVLHLRNGKLMRCNRSYRLLDDYFKIREKYDEEKFLEDFGSDDGEAMKKRKKKKRERTLQISEYDYSDLSRAT
jgi:hypothetical protein